MGIALPDSVRTLLEDRAYGHVVTRNPNGTPQLTMVWMDVDGDTLLFNTAAGRVKERNLTQDPNVIVSVQSREEPQAYVALYGRATAIRGEGADAHIDKLAKRFLNLDTYPWRAPNEQRLIVAIEVDRMHGMGPGGGPWT